MQDLSPDLKIGITLAILNCIGTIPVLKERVKICNKGSTKVEMVCFTKFEETPVWSGVFLFVKSLVAFRISFLVKLQLPNLKEFKFWVIKSTGLFGEGLMFATVFFAILVKNSLNLQAIVRGSSILVPSMVKCERSCFFLPPLFIEEKRICHVFRRFFWLSESCFSKWSFFAVRITLLYKFLNNL